MRSVLLRRDLLQRQAAAESWLPESVRQQDVAASSGPGQLPAQECSVDSPAERLRRQAACGIMATDVVRAQNRP
jgi:hypothetical protein